MRGTAPVGAHDEQEAAAWVRAMFGRVARHYDFANHLLSLNIDRYWRAHTAWRLRDVLARPEARVLDLCCGTGDLARALTRRRPSGAPLIGSDFCHPMLRAARTKLPDARLFEADALRLPLADASLDLIAVAFGFRNLANYEAGLREMRRVLRNGGVAAILEFSLPPHPAFRALYSFYSRHVLPLIGGAVSGSRDAYTYLPESMRRFPGPDELAEWMRAAGFTGVEFERLTGGIAALHLGQVSDQE
jgi:demethylmenaquinone methyltransferase / 2-methoxy-6-polyprenyl-1,4-benzoquinol methylase